jgi:hypothetical protein
MKVLPVFLILALSLPAQAQDCVILLHGLGRTDRSMKALEEGLTEAKYSVINVSYPSREHEIEELAEIAVDEGLDGCEALDAETVSFVTHSLGGILVRQFLSENEIEGLHRTVMLGPPNQGSEVVDNFENVPGFDWINGPAGQQLGTDEDDLPRSLGAAGFDLGVIAGNRSINPILSQVLPNPDDGKVSVENTKVDGMCSFVELPVSHALMMQNSKVISEVIAFLNEGEFDSEEAENGLCDQ